MTNYLATLQQHTPTGHNYQPPTATTAQYTIPLGHNSHVCTVGTQECTRSCLNSQNNFDQLWHEAYPQGNTVYSPYITIITCIVFYPRTQTFLPTRKHYYTNYYLSTEKRVINRNLCMMFVCGREGLGTRIAVFYSRFIIETSTLSSTTDKIYYCI